MPERFEENSIFQPDSAEDKPSRRDFLKKTAAAFGLAMTEKLAGANKAASEEIIKKEKAEDKPGQEKEINPWEEIKDSVRKLELQFSLKPDQYALVVNPERQRMYLIKDNKILKEYVISTAEKTGNVMNSNQTPYGTHEIYSKMGQGQGPGAVYSKGKFHGQTKIVIEPLQASDDLITSRVLKLRGLEENINRGQNKAGENVNSETRGIYLHGTNEEGLLGHPESHGCIRMSNQDVIELFDLVPKNTLVEIQNKEYPEDE